MFPKLSSLITLAGRFRRSIVSTWPENWPLFPGRSRIIWLWLCTSRLSGNLHSSDGKVRLDREDNQLTLQLAKFFQERIVVVLFTHWIEMNFTKFSQVAWRWPRHPHRTHVGNSPDFSYNQTHSSNGQHSCVVTRLHHGHPKSDHGSFVHSSTCHIPYCCFVSAQNDSEWRHTCVYTGPEFPSHGSRMPGNSGQYNCIQHG